MLECVYKWPISARDLNLDEELAFAATHLDDGPDRGPRERRATPSALHEHQPISDNRHPWLL